MARKAQEITADKLSERLPIHDADDEFGHLAGIFNDTFGRLEDSFEPRRSNRICASMPSRLSARGAIA